MKKAMLVLAYALFALIVFLPLGVLISECFGYEFKLASYPAFALVTALLSVGAAVCTGGNKGVDSKAVTVLLTLTAPLSFINAAIYIIECGTALVAVSVLVCTCCCCCLAVKCGKPAALKTTVLILSALMVLPLGTLGGAVLLFGNAVQTAPVRSLESPDGTHYAEVVESDQGALGGECI